MIFLHNAVRAGHRRRGLTNERNRMR
jgi:hypothetical protein